MAKCDPSELTDLSDYSESTNEKIVVYKVHVFWEGHKHLKKSPTLNLTETRIPATI